MDEKIFYKFKNINDYTYDSLQNRYFYFSTPEKLNDPVDCKIPVIEDSSDENITKWLKHVVALSSAIGNSTKGLENLTPEKFRLLVKSKKIDLVASAEKANEKLHILSLTDCNTLINMWTHKDYCKNFSGICIGYKAVKLQDEYPNYYININNHNSNRTIEIPLKEKLPFFILKKIEYDNDRKHKFNMFEQTYSKDFVEQIQNPAQNDIIMYNLFHKTHAWYKEQEYRGFYFNPVNGDDSRVYHPDEIVESITFGKNCPNSARKQIYEIMKTYSNFNEINFYEARPGWKKIKATIHPIDKNYLAMLP